MAATDPVVDEVRYWLDRDEFGLLSAVARLAGVTPTSVSGWATGSARPVERHWPALEEAFGQRAGHLKRVAAGDVEPRSTPIEVTVPRPGSGTAVGRTAAPRLRPDDNTVETLRSEVGRLAAVVARLSDDLEALKARNGPRGRPVSH